MEPTPDADATDDGNGSTGHAIRLLVLGYFVLVVGVVGALVLVRSETNSRSDADRDILVTFTTETCDDRNNTKDALRETITVAIEGGSTEGLDLTSVPGFEDLDAATQIFFQNLALVTTEGEGQDSTEERLRAYRDSLVDEDCSTVADDLRKKLEAEGG